MGGRPDDTICSAELMERGRWYGIDYWMQWPGSATCWVFFDFDVQK